MEEHILVGLSSAPSNARIIRTAATAISAHPMGSQPWVHMATLRKKVEKDPNAQYIQTHIGIGYRMLKNE